MSNYVCIPCLDEWLDEIEPLEEDEDNSNPYCQCGAKMDKNGGTKVD